MSHNSQYSSYSASPVNLNIRACQVSVSDDIIKSQQGPAIIRGTDFGHKDCAMYMSALLWMFVIVVFIVIVVAIAQGPRSF